MTTPDRTGAQSRAHYNPQYNTDGNGSFQPHNGQEIASSNNAYGNGIAPRDGGQDRQLELQASKQKARAVMAASGLAPAFQPGRSQPNPTGSPYATDSNGGQLGRKRSRSGSRRPLSSTQAGEEESAEQSSTKDATFKEYLLRDQLHAAAVIDDLERNARLVQDLTEQLKCYDEERRRRRMDLARAYQQGMQGMHGYHGDANEPRIIYPSQRKRPGDRKTKELRISRKDRANQADQLEELAPIRLDLELDKLRLRDTFTWNIHDRVVPPELFAQNLVEDFRIPPEGVQPLVQQVYQAMQEQISDFHPHVFIDEEALDPLLPYSAYKNDEMRVLIKLNITIGQHTLIDQFDWDINSPQNSPEEFSKQMGRDLSLSGEFVTAIAHSIREQTQLFTKSLYISAHPFDGRPVEDGDIRESLLPSPIPSAFRPFQIAKEFTPFFYELNDADLERTELAFSREQRQQKRSVNRRGGPMLPDLKDRLKTWRTLLVSSVIPGCADTLESSGVVRIARTAATRSSRRRIADDDSDVSESSGSDADSPGPSLLLQSGGTARTRGIRGAASAAQAAMRATIARSATPELGLHHHETRPRRVPGAAAPSAGYATRETSVAEPSLVVRLRVGRDRLRQLLASRQPPTAGGLLQQGFAPRVAQRVMAGSPLANQPYGMMGPPPFTPGTAQRGPPPQGAYGEHHLSRHASMDGALDAAGSNVRPLPPSSLSSSSLFPPSPPLTCPHSS